MLFSLLNYPTHTDGISMEKSILYFRGSPVKMYIHWCVSVFILTNIAALSGISSGSTTLFVKVPVNQYLDLCSRFILL